MSIFADRQISVKKRLSKQVLIKIACNEWGTFIWLDTESITSIKIIEKKKGYNLVKYLFNGFDNYVWLSDKELEDLKSLAPIT